MQKIPQKVDFENLKVQNRRFSTKSVPISAVFPLVRFARNPKTALTGDPRIINVLCLLQ